MALNLRIFKIKDKLGNLVQFNPNWAQQQVLERYSKAKSEGRKLRLVIVKGRQLGITALTQRIQLFESMTTPGFSGYTVAHNKESVQKIFQNHLKYSWDTLPHELKSLYKLNRDNANMLRFENKEVYGSSVQVGMSARSQTVDFLHVSEAAYIANHADKWKELVTGTFEAAGSGHIIIETTAQGYNEFKEFYDKVKNGGEWETLFLGWTQEPTYTKTPPFHDDWKKQMRYYIKLYKLKPFEYLEDNLTAEQLYWYFTKIENSGLLVKQEYPFDDNEAFISTGDNFFNLELLEELKKNIRPPLEVRDSVEIYHYPEAGKQYIVSVDPHGDGGDNTVVSVWDEEGVQCAEYADDTVQPEVAAAYAVNLAVYYNRAKIGCETNGNGIATMNEIIKLGYDDDKLYKRFVTDPMNPRTARIPKYGWNTNASNRGIMLHELRTGMENGSIKINSIKLLEECKTFVKNAGKYEAASGKKDDRVMSAAIATQLAKYADQF